MASLATQQSVLFLFFLLSTTRKCWCITENVTVSLYYEALCPYCADFIANHLAVKLFQEGLASIVNLRLIPWGNAFLQSDGSFSCQHGPNECLLNAIEACTITIYPDVDRHFRFINCVERFSIENKLNGWANCFDMIGLGKVSVDCYKSGYGAVLERKHATETAQLKPPHRFVPWVVVNNQPLQEDFKNFASYVCLAYKGTLVPKACKSVLPVKNSSLGKERKTIKNTAVCYTEKRSNLGPSPQVNGPDECLLNTIQAYAIDVWADLIGLCCPMISKELNKIPQIECCEFSSHSKKKPRPKPRMP